MRKTSSSRVTRSSESRRSPWGEGGWARLYAPSGESLLEVAVLHESERFVDAERRSVVFTHVQSNGLEVAKAVQHGLRDRAAQAAAASIPAGVDVADGGHMLVGGKQMRARGGDQIRAFVNTEEDAGGDHRVVEEIRRLAGRLAVGIQA